MPDTAVRRQSTTLLSAADSKLQHIVRQARTQDEQVTITGHPYPDGGTATYNRTLSLRRAEAVRDRLITLGFLQPDQPRHGGRHPQARPPRCLPGPWATR